MNQFALAALRERLDLERDTDCQNLMRRAVDHWSQGLSCFKNQRFDLAVFLDTRYEEKAAEWGIVAKASNT